MTTTPTSSPTRAVLQQIEGGAASIAEIAARTRLDSGVVSLAIQRLVDAGYLTSHRLASGCPDEGCGTCPSGHDSRPGCGAAAPGARDAGPVLLTLGPARR